MSAHNFNNAARGSLTVRFSTSADANNIFNFYNSNQHSDFDARKPEIINDRAKTGRVIIVESGKTLGMSSIGYDFYDPDNPNKPKWIEIGTTRSVLKGMNLYPFIIASQVINEFLNNSPEEKFIANVYETNTAVCNLLGNKVGWKIFEPDDDILSACKATKADDAGMKKRIWYEATSDTLPHQARIVSEMISRGYAENKKTGEKIPLDLSSFSLAHQFHREVGELAHGRFGEMMEKSEHLQLWQTLGAFKRYLNGATYFPEMRAKP